ncbi:MAG: tRNA (guanosine(46)-N7)-methyltransferase TrmB [Hyphomonadaceae bacterium]|jgi:tRNA (guanine-N7-)-methyltransferase|nr:tRNA (guanosine(46)-N7)-methyltransferase TrmB [Hyphomonadaceae bacterium]
MTPGTPQDHPKRHEPLRSYGRMRGRKLSPRQAELFGTLLPEIELTVQPGVQLEPTTLVPAATSVHFEIGFGGGEHLAASARRRPDTLHIGAEPFEEGVAKLLTVIDSEQLGNIRIIPGDARPFLSALAPACLDRLVILFPDPWHKARHAKRRLIQPAFVDAARQALKPGGELRFATDWADYADHTLQILTAHPGFKWLASDSNDWTRPPPDHVTTRYETKQLGDCPPVFLQFEAV